MSEDLKYPVGKFQPKDSLTRDERNQLIGEIAVAPARLRAAVRGLDEGQLDTPYRPGGWSVRQVAHHLPDSHLNAYIRFKLALTEENPTIRPYDEAKWAELDDARLAPPDVSLELLDSLHRRMVAMLEGLPDAAFARTLLHPDSGPMNLDRLLGLYAWHGRHHVAHITSLRKRMTW